MACPFQRVRFLFLFSLWNINLTVGNYSDNLNELAKRLNDKTTYEAVNVSDNPMNAEDFDLIPDLRINDPNAEEKFLNDEFEETDQRVLSLLNLTQKQYPAFQYKREIKTDTVPSNSAQFINGQFVRDENQYRVVTYKVSFNGNTGSVRFWLRNNSDSGFGKGIFGLFNESYMQSGYNGFNFGATVNRSGKALELSAYMIYAQTSVKNGSQLGEYIFKNLMKYVKS